MCLDRKSMGLAREEIRQITARHTQLERTQVAMEDAILHEFTQGKPISKSEASQAIKTLKDEINPNTAQVQHWPAKISSVQGKNRLRYNYARTTTLHYATKDLTKEELQRNPVTRVRDTQSVVFAQCETTLQRRHMHVQHSLCGVSLNFHTLSRMVERGFSRSHPATTLMGRQDFPAIVGMLMMQGLMFGLRNYDKTHSAVVPVDDAVLVGMHLLEYIEDTAAHHLGTTPAQMHATADWRMAETWGGSVGKISLCRHPLLEGKNKNNNSWFQPSVRVGTYLDHNTMVESQWRRRDELAQFMKQHANVLTALAHSLTNHTIVDDEHSPDMRPTLAHLRELMDRRDWRDTFRSHSSVLLQTSA